MLKNFTNQRVAKAVLLLLIAFAFSSCATQRENRLMGDVIGFSDDIQTSFTYDKGIFGLFQTQSEPYNLFLKNERDAMDDFIYDIPEGQNTAGYYALDVALDRIKYVRKKFMHKDPETKYYIIFLTDGLDNVSEVVARKNHQSYNKNIDSYIKKIDKKKKRIMGCGSKQDYFQIYPILFTGGDLEQMRKDNHMSEADFKVFVTNQMEGYRGASKGTEVPPALSGRDLNALVKEFEEKFSIQGFEFHVPKGYLGKRVRMTLTDRNGQKATIEGTYEKTFFNYIFRDITFSPGLVSGSVSNGGTIKAKSNDRNSLLTLFMMDALKLNGKPFRIAHVEQHYQQSGLYVPNSEYEAQADSRKNAYVLMIIDGSASFAENSREARNKAIEMIRIVTRQ